MVSRRILFAANDAANTEPSRSTSTESQCKPKENVLICVWVAMSITEFDFIQLRSIAERFTEALCYAHGI
jgi:hypothetical protein